MTKHGLDTHHMCIYYIYLSLYTHHMCIYSSHVYILIMQIKKLKTNGKLFYIRHTSMRRRVYWARIVAEELLNTLETKLSQLWVTVRAFDTLYIYLPVLVWWCIYIQGNCHYFDMYLFCVYYLYNEIMAAKAVDSRRLFIFLILFIYLQNYRGWKWPFKKF